MRSTFSPPALFPQLRDTSQTRHLDHSHSALTPPLESLSLEASSLWAVLAILVAWQTTIVEAEGIHREGTPKSRTTPRPQTTTTTESRHTNNVRPP